ncbi:TonB-dependent receptor [Pelomonas cellulosilytica]|uniref:TonB-dependent receptor n=1 Tax=Pelomonas cellulosilytica TaxID=2906762 RepID=A0ABS8XZ83_9BURK|nr:TonB-dependent receptor [Pelomonas sp. P8]MCE4556985.1 TonB-dependent receptor [Pelomonas sp. P8]
MLQRVEVVGTRASLQRSLTMKRNAAGVQDSISATELGRFPDDNVADSLSHITGVAIQRAPGGEGLSVSVRGLGPGYSLTTLNGRILATDGIGRDFAFDALPAEVISGADVVKSAQAIYTDGAIGGLVALHTARPFDQKGLHAFGKVEADHNTMSGLDGAKASGVWSNTFAGGTMGLLVGAVVQHRRVRTDTAEYTYFYNDLASGTQVSPGEGVLGTCCMTFGATLEQKKRSAANATFEWRPSAELKMTVDGLYTRLNSPQVGYRQAYYPQLGPGRWSDVKVDAAGLVTGMTVTSDFPLVPELANITVDRRVITSLLGWNAEWKPSTRLAFELDAYESRSRRNSGGNDSYVVADRSVNPLASTWKTTSASLPDLAITLPDGTSYADSLAQGHEGNATFGPHYIGLSGDNLRDRIRGVTLAGRYAPDLQWGGLSLDRVSFGLSQTQRAKSRVTYENDFTGGSVQYSGSEALTFASMGANVFQHSFTLSNFMPGAGGNVPRTFLAFDNQAYLDALKALDGKPNPNGGVFDLKATLPQVNPTRSYRVQERVSAAYLQLDASADDWSADLGLRLVRTRTVSESATASILQTYQVDPTVPTSAFLTTYGDLASVNESGSYTKALPSLNVSWRFAPNWQLRAGAAKTLARPGVDQLAPTQSDGLAGGIKQVTIGGDPKLKPYSARQFDLSLEWYYRPRSGLTLAAFRKQINGFITTVSQADVDLGTKDQNGQPVLLTVTHPVNGDRGSVQGFELGWQHLFDNGFGLRGQATHNTSRAYVGGVFAGPLENVAPATTSFGVLYERDGFSGNLSWDHTGSFTVSNDWQGLGVRAVARPTNWVTAQVSYEIARHLKLTLEGRNLTNSIDRQYLDISFGPPLNYAAYGRSFTLGLSYAL